MRPNEKSDRYYEIKNRLDLGSLLHSGAGLNFHLHFETDLDFLPILSYFFPAGLASFVLSFSSLLILSDVY